MFTLFTLGDKNSQYLYLNKSKSNWQSPQTLDDTKHMKQLLDNIQHILKADYYQFITNTLLIVNHTQAHQHRESIQCHYKYEIYIYYNDWEHITGWTVVQALC